MSDNPNGFTIAGRLPSLNDYINACRSHWSKGAALKRETEDAIIWHKHFPNRLERYQKSLVGCWQFLQRHLAGHYRHFQERGFLVV